MNLPVQTTSLIGRDRELVIVRDLLLRDDVRLLTLTGPGGSGKTRLALHVAADLLDRFADGVYFVDLAPTTDPSSLTTAIANVLGVSTSGERPQDDLQQFLKDRSLLLVLDNFEQLVAAGPVVTDLLAASAGLKALVTSRAALQVRGEHGYDVPPLATPDPERLPAVPDLRQYPAVALFVERAQAIRPDLMLTPENAADVATICARLDGLPLALELAAARGRLLTPAAMVQRLKQRLPLLSSGPRDLPARQRTLRDTIAWSYDLLDADEQQTFRGLAVFVGGFTLGAVEAVLVDEAHSIDLFDVVERLVAQSLVRADHDAAPEPRFRMLETIREFALEQLEASGEAAQVRDRHLRWCVDLEEQSRRLSGGLDQAAWLDRLEREHSNLVAALAWAEQSGDATGRGLALASDLSNYWAIRGHHREARGWLARLLVHSQPRSAGRAAGLRTAGLLAQRQHDYEAASEALAEAIEIMRELGDRAGVAFVLSVFGVVPHHRGDFDTAQAMFEESVAIARELGDARTLGVALRCLGDLMQDRGEYARAAQYYEESLALARKRQVPHDVAYNLRGLGNLARAQGQYARAEAYLRESLALLGPINDRRCIPLTLEGLACITIGAGWADRAARLLGAAQAMQAKTGAPSPPSAAADYQRTVADARQALGPDQFDRAWAEGAALGLAEAVDLALAEQPRLAPIPHADAVVNVADAQPQPAVPLSPREREVVALIAGGRSNREIAEALVLSIRTVERHIENVYNRLGISGKAGRAIVTAYAIRHGLIEPDRNGA